MMDFFRKHMQTIFIITIIGFLAGAFIGFGSYLFGGKTTSDDVAKINGTGIPYRNYTRLLNRVIDGLHQSKTEVTDTLLQQKRQEVLQDLIQEEVFWQQAHLYGITVSDGELAADIQQFPAFQKDGRFDRMTYFQTLAQIAKVAPRDFEESRRKQIASAKLRQLIASTAKVTEPELQQEYARTRRGSLAGYEKERQKLLERMMQEKAMLVMNDWFRTINQTMKIQVFLDEIERQPAGQ